MHKNTIFVETYFMKKIFCLIAALSLLSGCDDGDMTFKSFDFSGVTSQSCNNSNIYFKINGEEALILTLSDGALLNEETEDGPREVAVGGDGNTIIYRDYEGTVTSSMLCATPAPAFPGIQEEWTGDGTLLVETQAVVVEGRITGYNHEITIQSATFTKGDESVTINNNLFGTITREFDFTFDFIPEGEEEPEVKPCDNKNLIYTLKGREALVFEFEEGLFDPDGATIDLTSDDNEIYFLTYDGTISEGHICDNISPATPELTGRWEAISGFVIIETTSDDPGFSHKIYFKDVILEYAGETILINDIAEIEEGEPGYYFGNYTTAE